MLADFDEINAVLSAMRDEGLVEPIDDPNVEVDFWDWADIIGVVDEFVPQERETIPKTSQMTLQLNFWQAKQLEYWLKDNYPDCTISVIDKNSYTPPQELS